MLWLRACFRRSAGKLLKHAMILCTPMEIVIADGSKKIDIKIEGCAQKCLWSAPRDKSASSDQGTKMCLSLAVMAALLISCCPPNLRSARSLAWPALGAARCLRRWVRGSRAHVPAACLSTELHSRAAAIWRIDDQVPSTSVHATPVGFEPTRGDPIGLAGRRLSHSAKVSMMTSRPHIHNAPQPIPDSSAQLLPPARQLISDATARPPPPASKVDLSGATALVDPQRSPLASAAEGPLLRARTHAAFGPLSSAAEAPPITARTRAAMCTGKCSRRSTTNGDHDH